MDRARRRARSRALAVAIAVMVFGATFAALVAAYLSALPVAANNNAWLGLAFAGRLAHADAALREAPGARLQLQVAVSNHTHSPQPVRIVIQVDGGAGLQTTPVVLGEAASRVVGVSFSAPRRGGLHHLVLTAQDGAGVADASLDTWIMVGAKGS